MRINLLTVPEEIDVCDFLDNNPCLKGVVGQVLERYVYDTSLCPFPDKLDDAANLLADHIEGLGRHVRDIWRGEDTVENRTQMLGQAVAVGSIMISFLENIGNFKQKEQQQ